MHIFCQITNNAYDYNKTISGVNMMWLKDYFTIYVDLLVLAIGAYMAFVQSPNLTEENMVREGQFLKVIGYIYLGVGILGILIYISWPLIGAYYEKEGSI